MEFGIGHENGSSHGGSRVIRYQYGSLPEYAEWMPEAYAEWEDLEKVSGEKLLNLTGGVSLFSSKAVLDPCVKNLEDFNIAYSVLSTDEANEKYPMMRIEPEMAYVLEEYKMGAVRPDFCLKATVDQFVKLGGVLKDKEPVSSISEENDTVIVECESGVCYKGSKLIICAGTWLNRLLAPMGLKLDLRIFKITIPYWRETREDMKITTTQFHVAENVYLLPEMEKKGHLKFLRHEGPVISEPEDSSRSEAEKQEAIDADLAILKDIVKKRMPYVDPEPASIEHCRYTMSPDSHFIMDKLPGYSRIVVGGAFSGHGFKMAPVSGKILVNLATDKPVKYDLTKMNIARLLIDCK
ncbi:peroxisomal sarcosine oxidase-like [Convolutriloba macropyga]|uniref:peroxisomal sarcosine oxidase-like n=1 Tax=Convolutriloba macropyga TaxID=536237 RepID=UPI003F52533D